MIPKIYIILLNWNGANDTIECITSLQKIDYPDYEVILVDNHSDGDDVCRIQDAHGDYLCKIIVTDSNLGFSGGNNKGIEYAMNNNADYILLLNNDTIVEADFLSKLTSNVEESDKVGIYTPLINYYSKRDTVWCAGGYQSKLRASGFAFGIDQNEMAFKENRFCSFASGCCMLIKRDVFEKIGYLNEKYFLYLEDTDFCARTISAGYKIKFVGSSKIYHKVFSTTTKVNSYLPLYYSVRNRLFFARQNYGYIYYLSLIYIVIAFTAKSLTQQSLGLAGVKLIIGAFQDYFMNRMGKTLLS